MGDAAAREALVLRFLPLTRLLAAAITAIASSSTTSSGGASLGLLKAIDRVDPDLSNAFSSQFGAACRPVDQGGDGGGYQDHRARGLGHELRRRGSERARGGSQSLRNIKAVDVVSTGLRGADLTERRAHVRVAILIERIQE